MREVTPETAADYLREAGRVPAGAAVAVRALGWGVSNVVMRVEAEGGPPFVLKQARERLRTEAHWVSRLDRIWAETAALDLLARLLPEGAVPRILFDDPDNYLFAMTAAPDDAAVWKERLLAREADPGTARRAGALLGAIHAATAGHPALGAGPLADLRAFDELRVAPFYRAIARAHPSIAPAVEALVASMADARPPRFVHADFSPKNILVHPGGLTLVDFETAHAGDPAFDLGFFLSHLLLKAFRAAPDHARYLALTHAFWDAYLDRLGPAPGGLVPRAIRHAAACALARLDGTSPVDYLAGPAAEAARRFALDTLREPPDDWDRTVHRLARYLH